MNGNEGCRDGKQKGGGQSAALLLIALLFSYLIESMQYFNFLNAVGLSHNEFARTLIGYGFAWLDILAYTLGIITVLFVERWRKLHLLNES